MSHSKLRKYVDFGNDLRHKNVHVPEFHLAYHFGHVFSFRFIYSYPKNDHHVALWRRFKLTQFLCPLRRVLNLKLMIAYGQTVNAFTCPAGDYDYYKFSGQAGDNLRVDVDAKSIGSLLDPYLILYDSDGESLLAENDDELFPSILDPLLEYILPRDGEYYLKLKAWNHPGVGGSAYNYTFDFYSDGTDPRITAFGPSPVFEPGAVPNPVTLLAEVNETESGVDKVVFLYHSKDWSNADWVTLGEDTNPAGGWTASWNTASYPLSEMGLLVVLAHDKAGNITVAIIRDIFASEFEVFIPIVIRQ